MFKSKAFAVLIISLATATSGKQLNFSHFIKSDLECGPGLALGLQIIFRFFNDQHFMTLMDLSGEHSLDGFRCTKGNTFRPVTIYESWDKFQLGPAIDKSSVTSLPTIQGYFIKCSKEDVLEKFYHKIGSYNPKIKLMFQLFDKSLEAAKEVLKVGFEKYKILNVAVIVLEDRFLNGTSSHTESSFCMYNPFSGSMNVRSPTYHCIKLNAFEIHQQLNEIDNFIKARVENLHGYPLKVDIFPYPMICRPVYDENKKIVRYDYADGETAHVLAKTMNFTPIYVEQEGSYGYAFPNGTFTGSLAALEYDKVDLVANPRLISDYRTTKSVFLEPLTMRRYKFIIHKRETTRRMMVSLLTLSDRSTNAIAISLMIIFPFVHFCIKHFEGKIHEDKKRCSLPRESLYVFGLYHNLSMPHSKFNSSRIIAITIVFHAMISASIFQGTIIKKLNLNEKTGNIKKIDELFDLNYQLLLNPTMKNVFTDQSGDWLKDRLNRVARTSDAVTTSEGIEKLIVSKNVAFLWSALYAGRYLDRYYDNKTGENLLEVVPETAFEFYIAAMAPKTSPFTHVFNRIFLQITEFGFSLYIMQLARYDNDKVWYQRMRNRLTPKKKSGSLSLKDLSTVFKIFVISSSVSVAVFVMEIIHKLVTK